MSKLQGITVRYPSRITQRHVGGNTTYTRKLVELMAERGVATGHIPHGPNAPLTALVETAYSLPRHRDSILHFSADTGAVLGGLSRQVVTVHGVASRWISTARNSRQEAIWRARVQRAIAVADEVITVSHSSARDVAEVFKLSPERIHVIEHGIEAELFAAPRELSDEVGRKIPERFILYLGNIEPRKNIGRLIQAMNAPEVRALGLPLVIAGKPAWNFSEIMSQIEAADNVIHLGFVSDDDRVALMQRCAAFAFPSLYEGFGFPVLEAMAAGARVVSSAAGSLEEVAGPSLLIDENSVDSIAGGLVAAVADDARWSDYPDKAKAWVEQYSWARSADRHIEVYERVVGA